MSKTEQQLRLATRRLLAYDEHGAVDGVPVFYFHGSPSTRLEWHLFGSDALARKLKVRVIVPDRPGLGRSDFQPGRRISDWPADVIALADRLALARFAVLGYSGGGPYAAACALKIPERFTHVGIVSGTGPFDEPGLSAAINPFSLRFIQLARTNPWLSRMTLRLMGFMVQYWPRRFIAQAMAGFPAPDQAALARPDFQRAAKGLMALFEVSGAPNTALMHAGPAPSDLSAKEYAVRVTGMTAADSAAGDGQDGIDAASASDLRPSPANGREEAIPNPMRSMAMDVTSPKVGHRRGSQSMPVVSTSQPSIPSSAQLNGCLTFLSDGRVMLKALPSGKTYRVEGILFSENANRLVHVSGRFGTVVAVEDPRIPSFVVDTVDELAPNCSAKITPAMLRRVAQKPVTTAITGKGAVNMGEMTFLPATITVNVGQKVIWKNSSEVVHNVVDDASKALSITDVDLPSSVQPFDSGYLQPGQTFSRVFTVAGVYRYVCTLHEANGMKGVVIVRPSTVLAAGQ